MSIIFDFTIISWNVVVMLKKTRDLNLAQTKVSSLTWNLNRISAHNYIKLSLLRAYLSTHKFDVICISETYRDFDTSHEHTNLEIVG